MDIAALEQRVLQMEKEIGKLETKIEELEDTLNERIAKKDEEFHKLSIEYVELKVELRTIKQQNEDLKTALVENNKMLFDAIQGQSKAMTDLLKKELNEKRSSKKTKKQMWLQFLIFMAGGGTIILGIVELIIKFIIGG